jgi:hypothetical protein
MPKSRPALYPLIPGCHGTSREQSCEHRGFQSRPVADAFGAPVLRDHGPDRPAGHGKADHKALTPCMPCSFGLLPNPRSMVGVQPDGPLEVTVTDRSIRLVTAACGTRMARAVRTTIISTWRRRLPPRGRVRPVLGDPPPRWQEPGGLAAARWGDSKPAPTESVGKTRKNAAGQCRDDDMAP